MGNYDKLAAQFAVRACAFVWCGCGSATAHVEPAPASTPAAPAAPPATEVPPADSSSAPGGGQDIFPTWPVDDGRFSAVFPEEPTTKRDPAKDSVATTFASGGAVVIIVCTPASLADGWRSTASAGGWRQLDFYGSTAMTDAEHDGGKTYLREQLEVGGRYCLVQASFRDAVPAESAVAQACLRSLRPRDTTAP